MEAKLTPKQRHYEAIREKTKAVKIAYADFCEARDEAREAKAHSDKLNVQLIEFINRGPELQAILEFLFEDAPPQPGPGDAPAADSPPGGDTSSTATPAEAAPPALPLCLPPDHWRLRPIQDLGMTEGLNGAMNKYGLTTIGKLVDYWGAGKYLTELKGIGREHYSEVTTAFSEYAQRHPEVLERADRPATSDSPGDETDAAAGSDEPPEEGGE